MTWFVHRNGGPGTPISSAHRDLMPGYNDEALADDNAEVVAFLAAAYPPAAPPKPTPLQWLRRLTPDKQQAIFVAAASSPVVLGWLFEADGAGGGIDVADPVTAQGVAVIAAAVPSLTAADQALLLAP